MPVGLWTDYHQQHNRQDFTWCLIKALLTFHSELQPTTYVYTTYRVTDVTETDLKPEPLQILLTHFNDVVIGNFEHKFVGYLAYIGRLGHLFKSYEIIRLRGIIAEYSEAD